MKLCNVVEISLKLGVFDERRKSGIAVETAFQLIPFTPFTARVHTVVSPFSKVLLVHLHLFEVL